MYLLARNICRGPVRQAIYRIHDLLLVCNERPLQGALENRFGVSTVNQSTVSYHHQQEEVNAYFQSQSSSWKDIYAENSVQAEIYRARQARALAWIDELALVPGSHVLEVGCGAGFLSVELAQRGLRVHAIDSAQAMVELARQYAAESGIADLLSVDIGDVYALAFEDGCFDLVFALGVIPWLARPELAMHEMARVSKPGGHVLLTADNRSALHLLLDPALNPALTPLRRAVKPMFKRIELLHQSQGRTAETLHNCHVIDEALGNAELVKTRDVTLGFGPFTFLHCKFFPKCLGIALQRHLQRLADRNLRLFRSGGSQYLVLARKSASVPSDRSTSAGKTVSKTVKVQ